jgi:hypothetical protein
MLPSHPASGIRHLESAVSVAIDSWLNYAAEDW